VLLYDTSVKEFIIMNRRAVSSRVRPDTSRKDFLVIISAGLPFLTGYFLTHGTLEAIPFFAENMTLIHVLSAEAMILIAFFLFCITRLDHRTQTGCASWVPRCATGTLETKDLGTPLKISSYSPYQCISCGACVSMCPESAADLRHGVRLEGIFQIIPNQEIRSDEDLLFCPNCGKTIVGDLYRKLTQSAKKPVLSAGLLGLEDINLVYLIHQDEPTFLFSL
jgi:ferredoxin